MDTMPLDAIIIAHGRRLLNPTSLDFKGLFRGQKEARTEVDIVPSTWMGQRRFRGSRMDDGIGRYTLWKKMLVAMMWYSQGGNWLWMPSRYAVQPGQEHRKYATCNDSGYDEAIISVQR